MNIIDFCVGGLIAMLSGVMLGSCQASNGLEDVNNKPFGENVTMVAGVPYRFTAKNSNTGNDLVIQINRIAESRCPEGLNCITAGNVEVQMLVKAVTDSSSSQTINMCLGDCETSSGGRKFVETDSTSLQLASHNYTLILLEVNPYPTAENTQPKHQKVVLRVEQQ